MKIRIGLETEKRRTKRVTEWNNSPQTVSRLSEHGVSYRLVSEMCNSLIVLLSGSDLFTWLIV